MPTETVTPVHQPGGVPRGPVEGRFIDYGDSIQLRTYHDGNVNLHSLDRVRIITSFWGGAEEGVQKFPRLWVYDALGGVVERGDIVTVFFADGDPHRPIVMGAARLLKANAIFAQDQRGADPNTLLARLAPQAAGKVTGDVRMEAGFDGRGELDIKADYQILQSVGGDMEAYAGGDLSIKMAHTATGVEISQISPTEPGVYGSTFLGDLSGVLAELIAIGAALGVPATNAAAMQAKITASLAQAGPGTYLMGLFRSG